MREVIKVFDSEIYEAYEEYAENCLECNSCEKRIGLCPLDKGGNGKMRYMGVNNCDEILISKKMGR